MAQQYSIRLPMQETWVPSLGQEDPLEEEIATRSNNLAWKIPWTAEPDGVTKKLTQLSTHTKHTHS